MINIGSKSLKGLEFFSKKEKKQDKTQVLIQIINKIEKENPEKGEQLQDIKMDIVENVPLTNEKKIYLKKEIDCYKIAKKNPKQEIKKQDFKIECDVPEFENTIRECSTLFDTLEQMIKEIGKKSDLLYQETKIANEKNKLEQIKEKNNMLQNNLRKIISNLNITHTEILNQLNKARSIQIKMVLLDNELDLKEDCLK